MKMPRVEMPAPETKKPFWDQTRLTGVKICFDAGHAHLAGSVPEALEIVRDFVATTHLHDNRGEHDDHLLPYEGSGDWSATLAALPAEAPMVLEFKEPASAAGSGAI